MRDPARLLQKCSRKLATASLFVVLGIVTFASVGVFEKPQTARAATSSNLNFQARLLDSGGNVVADGYYNIEFKLYDVSSGGSALWTETYYDSNGATAGNDNRARVVNGYLSVNLGSQTAFGSSVNWDQEHWITMNVGGATQTATPTWDGEMNPRMKLTAVPYAFKAGELAKTTGGNVSTLKFDTQTAANSILLPDEAGTICIRNSTNCGFAASSGSANYIQNSTSGQTANFNIQSAANTSVGGVIQGASSQSADLLQFKDSSGAILTAVDASGKLVFGPSGSQDTNLYRDAANTLKTDDNFVVGGNLTVADSISFSGTGTTNFTTPTNATVTTRINVPIQTLGTNEQILAFGLDSSSDSTARAISVFDARAGAHQPTMGVFNPLETDMFGFSWEGSNTDAYLKTLGSNITIRANTTDIATFDASGDVGIAGKLTLNGAGTPTTSSDGLQFGSDVNLYRAAANVLQSNSALEVQRAASTDISFASFVAGDTNDRFIVRADGKIEWGSGSGAADTNLYRDGANSLKTDDSLTVTGNLAVLGSSTFSTGSGTVSLNGDTTIDSGKDFTISGGAGSQFTNQSSTLNAALALGDLAAGAIGTAANTVDIRTAFTISPTASGRTYTIPSPTDPTAGRIIYISNINATNSFIIGSATYNAGSTGSYVWDGSAWRQAGIDTGVTTVGSLNGGTANGNGATITGTTIYLQAASTSYAGLVDTTTQSFTGAKTFTLGTSSTSLTATNTSTGAALVANNSSTGYSMDVQSNGTSVFRITNAASAEGSVVFQNKTNNSTALQIQNSAGSNVLSIDTTPVNTIISNQSFEAGTSGWAANGTGASIAQNTSNKYIGGASLAVTTGANANTGAKYTTSNSAPTQLSASTTYTFSWYAKLASGTFTDIIAGYARDGSTQTNCSSINTQTVSTSGWTRYSCTITTDGTAPSASAYIYINQTTGTARTFYVDGVQIETGTTATAFKESGISLNGTISSPMSLKNQENSTTAFRIQNASGVNLLTADTLNSRLSVGNYGTGTGQLFVGPNIASGVLGTMSTGGFSGPYQVFAQGRYVYASMILGNTVNVYDFSDPANPVATGGSVSTTNTPYGIWVVGKYAYVVTNGNKLLTIDVSNPASISVVSTFTLATTTARSIYIQGRYAYITDQGSAKLQIVDIGNPTNPITMSVFTTTQAVASYQTLYVQGRYAYIAQASRMQIVDVSDPSNPSSVSNRTVNVLNLTVQGRYLYGIDNSNQLQVFDVKDPSSTAAAVTTLTMPSTNYTGLQAQGNYLYALSSNGSLSTIDITNPASPSTVGTTSSGLSGPVGLSVSGRYAYVGASANIYSVDLGGTYTQNLEAGVIETGTLSVRNNFQVANDALIGGGLAVGGAVNLQGSLSASGPVLFGNRSNSITAFQVQNAANSILLGVDTSNGIVSLGTTTYSAGSISQTGTAITGSSTAFTAGMTGGTIYYSDGATATVTYVSGTSLTSSISKSVTAGSTYRIVYGGLNVNSGGVSTLQTTTNSSTAFLIQNATKSSIFNVDTTNGRIGINTSAPSADLTFGDGATRTINVQTRTSNAAGSALTISAGAAGSGASAFAGGVLTLQGGAAGGTGNANGGAVTISGGAAVGTGTQGLVNLSTSAFTSAAEQAFTSSTSITAGNVDLYSSLPVKANTNTGSVLTVPDPAQSSIGRLLYITARSGSLDFTMRLNSSRTPIDIAMKQNSTATLIWNGTDWTAAGASSSTDLQSAYNNTLTSAGGAELVLNAPGGNADGLTIRNNATTPITGGILEVQTSIGSNLFSVNNNATEYATNGGAETQGASSSTFPSSTWAAAPAGGTVTRNTTTANNATGQASVSVVTTAVASHGAADTLSAALTANLQYTVSFTVKGATNFTTLDVIYSRDGTNTSTTTCTTGKTVTTSVWTRVTCTFTAPSSGITSSNAIFIRQSDATARTFYIDNLSVNVNASVNHAADGSVDSALGTNWTQFDADGGAGTTTLTRDTTTIYDTSASVSDVTTAHANEGMRNNLTITPSVSTQYLVTFYAKLSSGTFTDITVGFLPAGGNSAPAAAQLCTDYNTQTVSTSAWTKITCIVTTPSSGITDPDIVIYQPTATARTFYVDALTVTLNTNTASNVQVGQGNKGGPTTLFTLDRSSTAPIADNNDAYLGSMYYDTTSGRIQCYEADGWGACGAAPDNIVNLNPEFAGAVLNGSGVGTMSADFCGNGGGLSVNTGLCSSGQARNYYKWTSPQATQQTYSIYVTYQLPASFKNFASDDTVQLTARTDNTTNGVVTYEMFRNESGSISACGSETTVTSTINTWQTVGINGNESTSCGFSTNSGNAFVIFKINVKANSNANVYVGTLAFTTQGR